MIWPNSAAGEGGPVGEIRRAETPQKVPEERFGMNKAIAAAKGVAVSIGLLLVLLMTAEVNAQLSDRTLSLAELARQLRTPESIANYLWRNFIFESDWRVFGKEEYRQSPEEFLSNRRGDCEDFANMAYQLLRLNGYEAFLLNIYGDRLAHTICIFKVGGEYQAIDGSALKQVAAKSLNELVHKIRPSGKEARIGIPLKGHGENGFSVQFAKSFRV